MKKHLLFFATILFMALPSMAQEARVRPHHRGGHPQQNAALTVVAPQHERFWLYVDGVLQNDSPVHSICIRNLWDDSFYIRVELDNPLQNCVGQFVEMKHPQTLNIVERHSLYGLEFSQTHVRPELTMDLIINQPFVGHEASHIMPPAPPAPPFPQGMNPKDYDEALRMISKEGFDDTKLTIAKQVISRNPMTVEQIINICKLFSFENNKLDFAKYAYHYCVEKNKYYLLNEVFTYDSSKQELNKYIQGL